MDTQRPNDRFAVTVAAWRTASEAGDTSGAVGCLSDDVVLVSPLTEQFRFRGRTQLEAVLASAFEVIHGIRFHTRSATATPARCSTTRTWTANRSRRRSCCASTSRG